MDAHSSILAWRIPWTESLGGSSPWGGKESDTIEQLTLLLEFSGKKEVTLTALPEGHKL